MRTEQVNLRSSINETFREMAQLPAKEIEEKLERVEDAFHKVNDAISAGIGNSKAMQRAYTKLATAMQNASSFYKSDADKYSSSKTYVGANADLSKQIDE